MLAIMAIPNIIKGVTLLSITENIKAPDDSSDTMIQFYETMRSNTISSGIGSICKFIVYLFVSINFLRSGSLVRMFMRKKEKVIDN
jgi:hypothetical protein